MSRTAWSGLAVVLLAIFGSACSETQYRAETQIGPDGRVRRAIYQPESATPAEALDAKLWQGTTWAPRILREKWRGPIAALPRAERSKDNGYFAAWGEFASVAELPRAYVHEAPPGLPDGALVVRYVRQDRGLVVTHSWEETLTDVVTFQGARVARQELADLVIPLGQKMLDRALGDEYDTSALAAWSQDSGRAWFYEFVDIMAAQRGPGQMSSDEMALAFAPSAARHGLEIVGADGKLLASKERDDRILAFAMKLLREKIRLRDGKAIPEAKVKEILQAVLPSAPEEPGSEESLAATRKIYEDAAKAVLNEEFGSEEKFEARFDALETRITGLYNGFLFGDHSEFTYSLELPGRIVETNGTLLSDQQVRWQFDAHRAYPSGYAMTCYSLELRPELEAALLGRLVLTDTAAVLRYLELLNEDVHQALVASLAAKSLAPFHAARARSELPPETRDAFDAMAELLKLPEPPR